jgi:ubiquinol oxidase
MQTIAGSADLEALNEVLNDSEQLRAYKAPYDTYKPLLLPRILGGFLVGCGNLVYGSKPSYLKFRAVEVIARVPYHSWASATFTLLTCFYANETKAMQLSYTTRYARIAQDNETMHVIVVSQLAKQEGRSGIIRHTIIPMLFAFFYFIASYLLFLVRPRWSYELNYLFESHAFDQYNEFLSAKEEELRSKPILSEFLNSYGRNPISQYEFFRSVRNDELIHRNQSVHDIDFEHDRMHRRRSLLIGLLILLLLLVCI